jgi:hypothetical protein
MLSNNYFLIFPTEVLFKCNNFTEREILLTTTTNDKSIIKEVTINAPLNLVWYAFDYNANILLFFAKPI